MNIRRRDSIALKEAASNGHYKCLDLLLKVGAHVNYIFNPTILLETV